MQTVWVGACEFAYLKSSQVTSVLLVWGPHFENSYRPPSIWNLTKKRTGVIQFAPYIIKKMCLNNHISKSHYSFYVLCYFVLRQ